MHKSFVRYACHGVLLSVMLVALSACAKMPQTTAQSNNPHDASAKTYGLTADRIQGATTLESLPDVNDQAGTMADKVVNSMVAPSDQTYYFAFNAADMSPSDYAALKIQANYLVMHPKARVRLEGNTDSRGSREYNIALGWRRDKSIQAQLLQYGVAPSQIVMVSYGKEKPAVDGYGAQVWALNRRVHLVYEVKT
jgi:outer membrane protein OmpA-like peptidoglycan-associated protein